MQHSRSCTTAISCAVLLATLGWGITGGGCSPSARHRILSTVFDGVPPPDTSGAQVEEVSGVPVVPASPTEPSPVHKLVVHPPYEDKGCPLCHEVEPGRRFFGQVGLRVPERELCVECHEDLAVERLRERYDWVHGPVAAGACTGCHSPHRSFHDHLLLAEAGGGLCLRCHDGRRLWSTEIHEDVGTDCFDCHEPHGGVGP